MLSERHSLSQLRAGTVSHSPLSLKNAANHSYRLYEKAECWKIPFEGRAGMVSVPT